MKKILLFLCVLVLFQQPLSYAMAGQDSFNYKILRNYKGFKHNDNSQEWTYNRSYTHHLNDMNVVLAIYLSGKDYSINISPLLLVGITDPETNEHIKKAKSIEFTINKNVYSYSKLMKNSNWKAAYLGFDGYELVNAFIDSDSISVKVTLEDNNKALIFNVNKKKFDTTIGDICKNLIDVGIWEYLDDDAIDKAFEYEEKYPLVISTINTQDNNKATNKNTTKQRTKMTLNEGKYIIGKDIKAGQYKITCLSSSAEDYQNAMEGLGGLYDTLDNNNSGLYSGYFSALGSMVTAFDEGVLVEIIGDYGEVLNSFNLKKGSSKTIKLEGKVALKISDGTCELESQ